MFPHVEAQYGNLPVHEWAVLVRRARQLELTAPAPQGEPRPAAAEARGGRGRELLLEPGEVAEGLLDRVGERAAGLAAAALPGRRHDGPEQRVVVVPAGVVAHGR